MRTTAIVTRGCTLLLAACAAAALAIDGGIPVQDVDYSRLRGVLLAEGQLLD